VAASGARSRLPTAHGEVGATVAVSVGGKLVVDLWAGHADAARTRPWTRDTIVNVASTTKGLTTICAHRLVDRGLLDLQAPVAKYWPEFAQAGKAAIPVHFLLSHRAGLPTRFGLGFSLPPEGGGFGSSSAAAFGCPGAGGSIGFADPEARVGFGYGMNQMQAGMPPDPRALRLIDALYASL
jgi:CubicO group peptidase (beta-lactamase class C family)